MASGAISRVCPSRVRCCPWGIAFASATAVVCIKEKRAPPSMTSAGMVTLVARLVGMEASAPNTAASWARFARDAFKHWPHGMLAHPRNVLRRHRHVQLEKHHSVAAADVLLVIEVSDNPPTCDRQEKCRC